MKQLFENWRQHLREELLMEISFKDALTVLDGNKTKKILKSYRYLQRQSIIKKHENTMAALKGQNADEREIKDYEAQYTDALHWLETDPNWQLDFLHDDFKKLVRKHTPTDLTDSQRGLVVLWFIKLSRAEPRVLSLFTLQRSGGSHEWEGRGTLSTLANEIENFFNYNQFMKKTDLMLVDSFQELEQIVETARDDIEAYQEKQLNLDAGEGTEVLRDDKNWYIAVLHNKGAVCHYGKATSWCTADPGGTMFEHYYKPTDPLFYFEDRGEEGEFGGEGLRFKDHGEVDRYQFHYGSNQFKDEDDRQLLDDEIDKLHNLLKQTGATEKYPIIKEYDYILLFQKLEDVLTGDAVWGDGRWIEGHMAEHPGNSVEAVEKAAGGYLDSLEPEVAHKLAVWASAPMTEEHQTGPGWIPLTLHAIHWLAGERFYDDEQVGLNIAERIRVDTRLPISAKRALTRLARDHSSEKVRWKALEAIWTQLGAQWMKDHEAPDGETYFEKYQAMHFRPAKRY